GVDFLNYFVRKAFYDQKTFTLTTPNEYLRRYPTQQVATPGASSWGDEGYWRVWLNETNEWIYPHLNIAQERMTELARTFSGLNPNPNLTLNPSEKAEIKIMSKSKNPSALEERALKQAARELLLAQASDWPFILRTGTSPDYARKRVKDHLLRFIALHEQLTTTKIDETWLSQIEAKDNIFPDVNYRYWA
ncbi:MAG: DUF1957 domain-containing protein, partial [Verrucomicrobiota bacterium]|nr:DUF1957 domain-containing protein [Verrucomicrobiota bacterium]